MRRLKKLFAFVGRGARFKRMAKDEPHDRKNLTDEEYFMLTEHTIGKAILHGDTATAIRIMEERLSRLATEKQQLLDRIEEQPGDQCLELDLKDMNQEIEETRRRLESYGQQHTGRN